MKGLSTLNFDNEQVRSMEEDEKRKAEREEECERQKLETEKANRKEEKKQGDLKSEYMENNGGEGLQMDGSESDTEKSVKEIEDIFIDQLEEKLKTEEQKLIEEEESVKREIERKQIEKIQRIETRIISELDWELE